MVIFLLHSISNHREEERERECKATKYEIYANITELNKCLWKITCYKNITNINSVDKVCVWIDMM